MKREDIEKHGTTAGCPGCIAIELGARAAAHGAACRARIEAAIVADGDPDNRVSAALARRQGDMEVERPVAPAPLPAPPPAAAAQAQLSRGRGHPETAGCPAASSSSAAAAPMAVEVAQKRQGDNDDWDDREAASHGTGR